LQINIETKEIMNEFKTFVEACNFLGKKYTSHISKCCKGIQKTAFNYEWKIAE
jgi:hypothetical protein